MGNIITAADLDVFQGFQVSFREGGGGWVALAIEAAAYPGQPPVTSQGTTAFTALQALTIAMSALKGES